MGLWSDRAIAMFQRSSLPARAEFDRELAPFMPNSGGPDRARIAMALASPRRLFEAIELLRCVAGEDPEPLVDIADFAAGLGVDGSEQAHCEEVLRKHGSDKSVRHDYHLLYAALLRRMPRAEAVLEVGLGTSNEDVVSTMGRLGVPGASLRALRELLPNAQVFGADIDRRILFTEERITTNYVDQTDLASVRVLAAGLPRLDLVIDDGLHSPDANMAVAVLALERLKVDGWLVVEDISEESLIVWRALVSVLSQHFDCTLVRGRQANVMVARRLSTEDDAGVDCE